MNKTIRILGVVFLVFLLMMVRSVASTLFYDPFINYFKIQYLSYSFPEYDVIKLFINLFFRYVINMVLSLGVIYLFFQKKNYVVFSLKFYIIAFISLSIIYYLLLIFSNEYLAVFYVRRMLIHPIFLVILIPAFYYQGLIEKEN